MIIYGSDMCRECEGTKEDLIKIGAHFGTMDAECLYDLAVDPDVVSDIITESKGRLPILRIGKRFFAMVGEIPSVSDDS